MSTDKIIEIKHFKRVLKELGIYTLWIKERRKQINLGQGFFDFRTDCFYISIDESITWNETKYCDMWTDLYCASYSAHSHPSDVIKNNELMNHLKANERKLL